MKREIKKIVISGEDLNLVFENTHENGLTETITANLYIMPGNDDPLGALKISALRRVANLLNAAANDLVEERQKNDW